MSEDGYLYEQEKCNTLVATSINTKNTSQQQESPIFPSLTGTMEAAEEKVEVYSFISLN